MLRLRARRRASGCEQGAPCRRRRAAAARDFERRRLARGHKVRARLLVDVLDGEGDLGAGDGNDLDLDALPPRERLGRVCQAHARLDVRDVDEALHAAAAAPTTAAARARRRAHALDLDEGAEVLDVADAAVVDAVELQRPVARRRGAGRGRRRRRPPPEVVRPPAVVATRRAFRDVAPPARVVASSVVPPWAACTSTRRAAAPAASSTRRGADAGRRLYVDHRRVCSRAPLGQVGKDGLGVGHREPSHWRRGC